MKITKIDGVSHYKEKEKGVLKAKGVLNEEIQKIVLEREWKLLPRVVKELIKKSINN